MKDSLQPGLTFEFNYTVPENRTVPNLLPEASEFQVMPKVLATGFMIGLIEWGCIQAVNPYIDWPREQTVGIGVHLSHSAATPPGMTVTIHGKLEKMEGKKLTFAIKAYDSVDTISEGVHERYIIDAEKFNGRVASKSADIPRK